METKPPNKRSIFWLAFLFVTVTSLISSLISAPVLAQGEAPTLTFTFTPTPEPTATFTPTPEATATPTEELTWEATSTPTPYQRPLITIQSYSAG